MAKHAASKPGIKAQKAPQKTDRNFELESLWARHNALWRDPAQITSQWQDASATEPELLKQRVKGAWWETLARLKITLLVGREYEHLLIAQSHPGTPRVSYMPMPHPSGIAVDRKKGIVHVASTRNPNQIYDLMPITDTTSRLDVRSKMPADSPLVPAGSRFFPGCLYMHDLAMVGDKLHANAVGQNAVIRINEDGSYKQVWWPLCVEENGKPNLGQNFIQLNSIAAGETIKDSFFSASSAAMSKRRPGHKNYPVDGRGVVFSGATRQPIAFGLTRPHSARLASVNGKRRLFIDNSGYGEFGFIEDENFVPVTKLPGWTRGLCIYADVAFVGTSRVIPKFSQYAPGLDVNASICGVHAIDLKSGKVLGSVIWPSGNQIFAIDFIPTQQSAGFPFLASRQSKDSKTLFYTFQTNNHNRNNS